MQSTESKKRERTRFAPPTLEEVRAFFTEEKLAGDAKDFHDHFANAGWRLSGGRGAVMKDWRLAAGRWSRNEGRFAATGGKRVKEQPWNPREPGRYANVHSEEEEVK